MATPDMATLHGVTPPASLPLLGRDRRSASLKLSLAVCHVVTRGEGRA